MSRVIMDDDDMNNAKGCAVINIDNSDDNNNDNKDNKDINMSLQILIIFIVITMYGILGIFIRLSMLNNNSYSYNPNSVLSFAEFGKFIISIILLIYFEGDISTSIESIKGVPFNQWLLFSIPAIIYSMTNHLIFWILQYMDPASMSLLCQFKTIITSILWWYLFSNPIDKQQCISLILLCFGSLLIVWPNITDIDDNKANINNKPYVILPMGPILIIIQICLSTIAGIYTEYVYKIYASKRSMHIDNLSMYFWGTLSNIFQFYFLSNINLLHGFNIYTYLLIFVFITMGISISYILKYFNSIIKLWMGGLSIMLSGFLTFTIFHLQCTTKYCASLFIIVSSIALYHHKDKKINFSNITMLDDYKKL